MQETQETWVQALGWEDPHREGNGNTLQYSWGFSDSSVGKESTCNVGDLGSVRGLRRFPEEGKGYPLQYSDLENSVDSMGLQRVKHG